MKRIFTMGLLLIVVLALVLSTGCLSPGGGSTANLKASDYDKQQDKRLNAIEGNAGLGGKADQEWVQNQISSLDTRLKVEENEKPTGSSDAYTKKEVDALISELNDTIADLEDELKQYTDNAIDDLPSGGSSGSSMGEEVDSDGDMELWLSETDPASYPMYIVDGGKDIEFEIYVKNNDTTSHRFEITLKMWPENDLKCSQSGTSITSSPTLASSWDITRNDWDGTANDGKIYFEMGDDKWIDEKDEDRYILIVTIDSDTDEFWNFELEITETD